MTNKAIANLLKQHHEDAYRWSYQCCRGNEDDAKDVLQLAYLKIVEGKAKFQEKSAFKTWLFSVIRFTAIDYFKKQRKLVGLDGIELSTEATETAEPDNYRDLLNQLPERQQQILTLAFYHHMTLTSIAEVTHLHIGTVRTHYERGKKALRELIKKTAL